MNVAGALPVIAVVSAQLLVAGLALIATLALSTGMPPFVLVTYRQLFASFLLAPLAFFMEWKGRPRATRPKITMKALWLILLCSVIGTTFSQFLYFLGLKKSSPTIASALFNTTPALTFLLAAIFRTERVRFQRASGQAKVLGTFASVGGALFLSFFHGHSVITGQSYIHWDFAKTASLIISTNQSSIMGPIFVLASAVCSAMWYIIQGKLSTMLKAPFTITSLNCALAFPLCGIIAACFNHKKDDWSIAAPVRLITSLYAGILCSGLANLLATWTVQKMGSVYVSMFSPVQLVLVPVISLFLLREHIRLGTIVGSLFIILGLYCYLWGKRKEKRDAEQSKRGIGGAGGGPSDIEVVQETVVQERATDVETGQADVPQQETTQPDAPQQETTQQERRGAVYREIEELW